MLRSMRLSHPHSCALCPGCGGELNPIRQFSNGASELTEDVSKASRGARSNSVKSDVDSTPVTVNDLVNDQVRIEYLSILFADIVGSTELVEGLGPDEAVERLRPARQLLEKAVAQFSGRIELWAGDGLMAYFGAPIAQEHHAAAACHAALQMHRETSAHLDNPVQLRIGIHSGEALFRVGSVIGMPDFSVSGGMTIHLASRLEAMAAPSTTLLSARTLRLTRGLMRARTMEPTLVRGIRDAVEIYQLIGLAESGSESRWSASSNLSPFIGRTAELKRLLDAAQVAGLNSGKTIGVFGEAGSGKSRLVRQFRMHLQDEGWGVLEAGCEPFDSDRTYRLWQLLLRSWIGMGTRVSGEFLSEKLHQLIEQLGLNWESLSSPVLALLEQRIEDSKWNSFEPAERRRRIVEAIQLLFITLLERRPLLILVEDIHWSDQDSITILDQLSANIANKSCLIVYTYRRELGSPAPPHEQDVDLQLLPLPSREAKLLVDDLLGSDASLSELKKLLVRVSGGNPLFLEETIASLIESRALVNIQGSIRLAAPLDEIEIPDSVQSILSVRLAKLEEHHRQLLQLISVVVVEPDITVEELEQIADLPAGTLGFLLGDLVDYGFLSIRGSANGPRYGFRHALIRETTYRSLTKKRRCDLHRNVLKTIESLNRVKLPSVDQAMDSNRFIATSDKAVFGNLIECGEHLAHHSYLAKEWSKALIYSLLAANRAVARSANLEAVAFYKKCIVCNDHQSRSVEARISSYEIRVRIRDPLLQLGRISEIVHYLDEAEAVLGDLEEPIRRSHLAALKAHILWVGGRSDDALFQAKRGLYRATSAGKTRLALRAKFQSGLCDLAKGNYKQAELIMRQITNALVDAPRFDEFGADARLAVLAKSYQIRALSDLGCYGKGLELADECMELANNIRSPFSSVFTLVGAGYCCLRSNTPELAISHLSKAVEQCEVGQTALMVPAAESFLGYALALSGAFAEGITLLKRSVVQAEQIGFLWQQPLRHAMLAHALLIVREFREAENVANIAMGQAARQGERGSLAYTLEVVALASALTRQASVKESKANWVRAAILASDLDMFALERRCRSAASVGIDAYKNTELFSMIGSSNLPGRVIEQCPAYEPNSHDIYKEKL